MEARKLLEYYYNLILYRPEYPKAHRNDHHVTDDRTYVPYESIFGGESLHGYELYIGKTETEIMSRAMGEEVEDSQSFTYLCMLRTDKRGYYIEGSFYIAPVLFALAKILKERNVHTQLDLNLINRANDEFDEFLTGFDRKLEYKELKEVFNYVVNKLNLSEYLPEFFCLVKERDPLGHHVNDGYLKDLEHLLSSRIGSEKIELAASHVRKVLTNASPLREDYTPQRVKEMTSPEKNPVSMWPGHEKLTLREQLILNQLASQRSHAFTFVPMVSRRGQALRILPELLTASLVERATAMTRYSNPDDAFTEIPFSENKEFASSYHMPEERLLTPALVIMAKGRDFLDDLEKVIKPVVDALQPAPYFTASDKTYMTARLTSNRDLVQYIRDVYKGSGEGLEHQMTEVTGDWEETRKAFREKLDEVLRKREEILQEYRTTMGYQDLLEKASNASIQSDELKARIESSEASKTFKENELDKRKAALEEHVIAKKEHENTMGFFKRWLGFLFPEDPGVVMLREMGEREAELEEAIGECTREMNLVMTEYHNLKKDLETIETDYRARRNSLEESAAAIAGYREKYGRAFADDETLQELVREDLALDVQLWVSEEYNDLRKSLLMEALKVHRSFITHSRSMKTDLKLFAMVMEGKIQDRDLEKVYIDLLKVFTIVTPVTCLSQDYEPYFLSVAAPDSMGGLILPEAGRMALSESMGTLRRFSKVTAFNVGTDHWNFPEVPEVLERNLASWILGVKDPADVDLSLADVMNVLS